MSLECKLSDKNMEAMLKDGQVDQDLGIGVPLSDSVPCKKEQEDNEDVAPLKEKLQDLKYTYQMFSQSLRQFASVSEAVCLSDTHNQIHNQTHMMTSDLLIAAETGLSPRTMRSRRWHWKPFALSLIVTQMKR